MNPVRPQGTGNVYFCVEVCTRVQPLYVVRKLSEV